MYACDSVSTTTTNKTLTQSHWHFVDGSIIKIKAFLGVCAISFQSFELNLIAALKENQLFVFDPKALYHIVVKVNIKYFFYNLHGFIFLSAASGSTYIWRNIVIYWVNCLCHSKSTMQLEYSGWQLTWRGNRLIFGPGLLGTLGIVWPSLLHKYVLTLIKGTGTESRERCWTLCIPLQICAKWACTVFLILDKSIH